ncbi:laccase, multicopper oxidase, benzenediol:oxygen oxidorectuctase [Ascochyta rabiei]|uniref:laccase n=1 Tax=Didymella rabiei TaxID=5454 RepID=A0A162VG12_DIDRA|nr:laccase, multicopper oxidase, benzenediol:oxygen oxidorectuctase [Ascochyta rabiei]KZM18436.1 copper ion binding [Ascochyta rabiei]UPX10667.1 laccase, multicopper oxidase, benzenediol:oxygen oxidorectuctase [Ascochyta rabiei]
MLFRSLAYWLSAGSLAYASAIPTSLVERQDGACTNTARTRNCWSDGYSIATDFDAKSPPDGTTVTYNLEISNVTKPHLDGSAGSRQFQLINGQYPGPTIRAKWGDTIVVNVKNNMQDNGTGIHWHGIRQLNSCQQDGVPGVTECPIAPGKTRQYKFRATQFGTTWYHSHWSAQYGDGVLGTMIIDGPATANYDEDLGVLPLTDYYYTPAFTLNEVAQHSTRGPPAPNNILVNGTHVNASGGGKYAKMTVTKGKKYRIRIINTSVDSTFSVSLDGHPFTVMTADFVPIKSYITTQVTLAIGQRYDVMINANQTVDNYWFRVAVGTDCGSNSMIASGVQMGAIVSYSGASSGNPTSTGVAMRTACVDEKTSDLVPFVPNTVPSSVVGSAGKLEIGFSQAAPANLVRWLIDGTPMIVDWNNPTLETTLAGSDKFYANANIHEMSTSNWYLWWIQSTAAIQLPHPIHLHGHDFYIVGEGSGTWDGSTTGLTLNNPTRRDTTTMPVGGYLLIAFPADNPGAWVMHCHIAWHASQGLSMQFLERKGEIQGAIGGTSDFKKGCDEWDGYWFDGNHPYNQTDSGL